MCGIYSRWPYEYPSWYSERHLFWVVLIRNNALEALMAKKRTASVSTYAVNLSGRARIYQRANHGEVIVVPDPDTMTVLYYRRGSWEQFHEVTVTWNPNLAVYFWRCQTMEGSGSFGYNPSGDGSNLTIIALPDHIKISGPVSMSSPYHSPNSPHLFARGTRPRLGLFWLRRPGLSPLLIL